MMYISYTWFWSWPVFLKHHSFPHTQFLSFVCIFVSVSMLGAWMKVHTCEWACRREISARYLPITLHLAIILVSCLFLNRMSMEPGITLNLLYRPGILALNSDTSIYICLLNAGFKDLNQHTVLPFWVRSSLVWLTCPVSTSLLWISGELI